METSLVIGLWSIGILVLINVVFFAFSNGKLHQKANTSAKQVEGLVKTVDKLEKHVGEQNGTLLVHTKSLEIACAAVTKLETDREKHGIRLTKLEVKE